MFEGPRTGLRDVSNRVSPHFVLLSIAQAPAQCHVERERQHRLELPPIQKFQQNVIR